MTSKDRDKTPRRETLKRQRKEMEEALNGTIEDTIREAALPNTIAWIVVVGGSFAINLLLLMLVSGG